MEKNQKKCVPKQNKLESSHCVLILTIFMIILGVYLLPGKGSTPIQATLQWCQPLYFDRKEKKYDIEIVTSASSMQWLPGWEGRKVVIIQDNANFVGILDVLNISAGVDISVIPPVPGYKERYIFPDNQKRYKNDFEASAFTKINESDTILLFGSGSGFLKYRQKVVLLTHYVLFGWETKVYDAKEFYRKLEMTKEFSGSELNIEGALIFKSGEGTSYLRIFQRGNGAIRDGIKPVDASCDINFNDFINYLFKNSTLPNLENIITYNLGTIGNVDLSFTDVSPILDRDIFLYIAAAEDSMDSYSDGDVVGASVGVIMFNSTIVKHCLITDEKGPAKIKPEGVVLDPSFGFIYVLLDKDTSEDTSDFCKIKLEGKWFV